MPMDCCTRSRKKWEVLQGTAIQVHPARSSSRASSTSRRKTASRAPSPEAQALVMSLIYDDVKAGRDGDPHKLAAVHRDLIAKGCDCGVLACTELSVFADKHHLPPLYTDAMAVLAERAVEACHRPLRHIFIK